MKDLASELLATWDTRADGAIRVQHRDGPLARLAAIFATAARAHRLPDSALLLIDNRHRLQALTLVRSAYEHAVTSQWLVQAGDGAGALLDESARQRVNAASTFATATSEVVRDAGLQMNREEPWVQIGTSSETQGRRFDALCAPWQPCQPSAPA